MNGEAGKGDTYRPVDKKKFDANWDKIFSPRCNCNHRIGENCEECYIPDATRPCLSRWCGDCNIKNCTTRTHDYESN